MARKSRKAAEQDIAAVKAPASERIPTALYARLSVENSGKDDNGAAIETQMEVCREYIKTCPYLDLIDTYVDNGYTGTVFSRPEFNRLMDDVRSGRIKAIIVRDLSRFGRNYIETGTYLERIFPKLGVRFISVKEQYDSFTVDGSNESLMIPLQNMINDLYSKDISRKVSAALQVQREQGTYSFHTLAYGYKWNADRSNIVPNYPAAAYVKQMFSWFLEGISLHEIADRLNAAGVPTGFVEREYRKSASWVSTTVRIILANPIYAGDKAFGRYRSAIYMGIKKKVMDREDWAVSHDDHEALVSREAYEEAQRMLGTNLEEYHRTRTETEAERATLSDLLAGKIYCADCGGRIHFVKRRNSKQLPYYGAYECARYRRSQYRECTQHYLSQKKVNQKILDTIKLQVKAAADYEKVITDLRESRAATDIRTQLNSVVQSLNLRLKGLANKRSKLYEHFTEGILDEDEYLYTKKAYDAEYSKLNQELDEAVQRRNAFIESLSADNKWLTLMRSISSATELTQELVDHAIERVELTEDKDIILKMKYHEIYEAALKHIDEIREKEAPQHV